MFEAILFITILLLLAYGYINIEQLKELKSNTKQPDKKISRMLYTKLILSGILIISIITGVKISEEPTEWKQLYTNQNKIDLELEFYYANIKVGEPFGDAYNARHYLLTTDKAPIFPVNNIATLTAKKNEAVESKTVRVTPENTTVNGSVTRNAKITKLYYRENHKQIKLDLYFKEFTLIQNMTPDVKLIIEGEETDTSDENDIKNLFNISE